MPRYFLNEFGLPEHEVDWVHELEVWSQRSGRLIGWIHTQNGDQWDAEVMLDGVVVQGVRGVGRRQQVAKADAAKQLDAANVLTI